MRSFFILLLSAIIFSSCDKCKDVSCFNDGECEDGECVCSEWYSGESCETKIIEEYEGSYAGVMSCSWYNPYYFRFIDISGEDNEMTIEDQSNIGSFRSYRAVFTSERNFDIPSQPISSGSFESLRASGSGSFQNSGLVMNITISSSTQGTSTLCNFTEY